MESQGASASPAQVEAFGRRHRTGLVTLLFSDMVGSTALKQELGDRAGAQVIEQHHALVRATLRQFAEGEELSAAGDSFFLVFATPSAGVKFALLLQQRLREVSRQAPAPVQDRMGLHLGEVLIQEADQQRTKDLIGLNVDLGARVMGLAQGGQVLLTRAVFDSARQALKGEEIAGVGPLSWLNHGLYQLKGIDEAVEICEVGEVDSGQLRSPATTEKARRVEAVEGEAVLGWRPAVGQVVPNTKWVLEQKLGEGGFGEVWLGRHQVMKERRVFKFCFRADRVRSLKREMTLFRLIKERIGDHPNIVSLREVYFDQPPYYVEMDYAEGQDLASWCEAQGGGAKVPLEAKLEIVAQIADALQAAHDAGVIHRDVKPGNILVSTPNSELRNPKEIRNPKSEHSPPSTLHSPLLAKLTDFGIGQVVSQEYLAGVTKAGFTQTLLASSSSQTGTQLYMAPELLAGRPASTRSDIYSLGVVFYQLLLGEFKQGITIDWARRIDDALLREDLEHCLAGEPEERYSGAAQLAQSLRAYERRKIEAAARERAARRHRLALAGFAAAGLLLLLALCLGYGLNQAREQRNLARRQRDRAGLEAYAADMKIADTALRENNLGQAMSMLRRHIPQPGNADLRGIEWRYLWQRCRGQQAKIFAHRSEVSCAELSPDGRWLATESEGKFWVWDTSPGGARQELASGAPGGNAEHLAFDPRGRFLATATSSEVLIWSTAGWRRLRSLTAANAVLSISGDGSKLATFGEEGIRIWNTAQWELTLGPDQIKPSFGGYRLIALNRDGSLLALSSGKGIGTEARRAGEVALWNVPEREVLLKDSEANDAQKLAFSDDGRWLAAYTWGPPGMVHLWSVPQRKLVARWPVSQGLGMALAFVPGGQQLLTAGSEQVISCWQTGTTNREAVLKGHTNEVWCLRFAADGRLVSASKDGTVRLWTVVGDRSTNRAFALPQGRLICPPGADAGRLLSVKPEDWTFEEWDVESGQRVRQRDIQGADSILGHGKFLGPNSVRTNILRHAFVGDWDVLDHGGAGRVAFLSAGRPGWDLFATTGDGRIYAWSAESGTLVYSNKVASGPFLASPGAAASKGLAVIENWSRLSWFDCRSNQRQVTDEHAVVGPPSTVAGSRDGRWGAYRTSSGQIRVWDFSAKRAKSVFKPPAADLFLLAFSPDSRLLAVATDRGFAQVWDVATAQPVTGLLLGHLAGIWKVSFSADSKSLVTYCLDYTAKVWNVATGREMLSGLPLNNFLVQHPSFGLLPEDGNTVIESAGDTAIRLVHLPPLAEIDALEHAGASARDGGHL